jgi:hypothetical protein
LSKLPHKSQQKLVSQLQNKLLQKLRQSPPQMLAPQQRQQRQQHQQWAQLQLWVPHQQPSQQHQQWVLHQQWVQHQLQVIKFQYLFIPYPPLLHCFLMEERARGEEVAFILRLFF